MAPSIEEKYKKEMEMMMIMANVSNRLGHLPTENAEIYEAWSKLYPKDAYCWISKALIGLGVNNISDVVRQVNTALEKAETNRQAAEDLHKWLVAEYPEEVKKYS